MKFNFLKIQILSLFIALFYLFLEIINVISIVRYLIGVIIIFYLSGLTLKILFFTLIKRDYITFYLKDVLMDIIISFIFNIITSSIFILTFNLYRYNLMILEVGLIIIANIILLKKDFKIQMNDPIHNKFLITTFLIIISSIIIFYIFKEKTPYPLISGYDIYPSLTCINWIIENHGYRYVLIPSYPTPGLPYPALFFYFISYLCVFLSVNAFDIYWWGTLLMIFSYIFFIFLISYKLSSNYILSLNSALIAFFLSSALAEEVRTPLYLTLDMTGQIIFLLIFSFYLTYQQNNFYKKILLFSLSLILLLYNYFTFLCTIPFLLINVINNFKIFEKYKGYNYYILLFFGISVPIIVSIINIIKPNLLLITNDYNYLKFNSLFKIYPPYFWILFSISLIFVIIYYKNEGVIKIYKYIIVYILFLFELYFYPFELSIRFEFYIRLFLSIFISSIFLFSNEIEKINTSIKTYNIMPKKIIIPIVILIISLFFTGPLFINYNNYMEPQLSNDEYQAFNWVKTNIPNNSYLITDPITGYIARGISLRNASLSFILPDGRAPSNITNLYPNLQLKLFNFFSSNSSYLKIKNINELPLISPYILITSRTIYWANHINSLAYYPIHIIDTEFVNSFKKPYFESIYNSTTVKIFKYNDKYQIINKTICDIDFFTNDWNKYIDGSIYNYAFSYGDILSIESKPVTSKSSWVGLYKSIDCKGATTFELKSKINKFPYLLEVIFSDNQDNIILKYYLNNDRNTSQWVTDSIDLSMLNNVSIFKIYFIIVTNDINQYNWDIDYFKFQNEIIYEK